MSPGPDLIGLVAGFVVAVLIPTNSNQLRTLKQTVQTNVLILPTTILRMIPHPNTSVRLHKLLQKPHYAIVIPLLILQRWIITLLP